MHLKRSLGLAAVVLAASAILIATAGAAQGPQKVHRQFHFKTTAAVLKYLKAHGVSTRGIVIQRSRLNYAGPKCPGKRWSCTKSKRVIQFSTSDSSNVFTCSASYPTPITNSPPNSCMIVQVNSSGDNNAKCVEQTSADGAQQVCNITQTDVSGTNNATAVQLINETQGQSQTGRQDATVQQQNGTGKNNVLVTQTITQTMSTGGPAVSQSQDGRQNNSITQNSTSGDQLSTMSQVVVQRATAGKAKFDSSFAPFAAAALSGSQSQFGDGNADVDQSSMGVSKAFNFQNMLQVESAPSNAAVTQDQDGPFRCCTSQDSNPSDVFNLQQSKTQFASSAVPNHQLLDEKGSLTTTGTGHISQFGNQNGTTQSNTCDVTAGSCVAETAIIDGEPQTCSDSGSEVFCCIVDCIELTFSHEGPASSVPITSARLSQASLPRSLGK